MSNLINLNDYRERRQQLEMVRFIPLTEGTPTRKVLMPIENAGGNLGLLIASYYEACAGCGNHVAEHVLYVRWEENQGEKYSSTEFDRVYFSRQGQLYTVKTEQAVVLPHHSPPHYSHHSDTPDSDTPDSDTPDSDTPDSDTPDSDTPEGTILPSPTILPLPSQYPYVACELTIPEYLGLKEKLIHHRRSHRRAGLEQAVDILTERAGFGAQQSGYWWWKKKILVTPEGYANQIQEWPGIVKPSRELF